MRQPEGHLPAPQPRAISAFSSVEQVANTRAPRSLAICKRNEHSISLSSMSLDLRTYLRQQLTRSSGRGVDETCMASLQGKCCTCKVMCCQALVHNGSGSAESDMVWESHLCKYAQQNDAYTFTTCSLRAK